MKLKRGGFALVEVIVAGGIVSIIGLSLAKMIGDAAKSQSRFEAKFDRQQLGNEIVNILSSVDNCDESLNGVDFYGKSINAKPVDIEIFQKTSSGTAIKKLTYIKGDKANKFGKVFVKSLKLSMPLYTTSANFPTGTRTERALIKASLAYKLSGKEVMLKTIENPISITFSTSSTGLSSITTCNGAGTAEEFNKALSVISQVDFGHFNCVDKVVKEGHEYMCPYGKYVAGGRVYHEGSNREFIKCCNPIKDKLPKNDYIVVTKLFSSMVQTVKEGASWQCGVNKFVDSGTVYHEGPNYGKYKCNIILQMKKDVPGIKLQADICHEKTVGEGKEWSCDPGFYLVGGWQYHEHHNRAHFRCCKLRFLR